MRRQTLLLAPLVAFAFAGVVHGESAAGTTEKKVEIVKCPVPGSPDAVGEVATQGERAVLADFYRSKALAEEYQAATTNNADLFDRLMADQAVNNDERFGRGVILTKAAWVANFRSGRHHQSTLQHDHVRLTVFSPNTVVVTGHSTSVLRYGGRLSPGPRLITEIWVKLDGRWQLAVHAMSDLEGGMEPRSQP